MSHRHYKTLWMSDLHLGNRDCKAEHLLNFLNNVSVDTLYLVGDIIDMWEMTRQFRWPDAHNQVVKKILSLSESGTRVIYLPGNHDAPVQSYTGMALGDIEIARHCIHTTAAGKRYVVLHGDQFDDEVTLGQFHAWLGDKAYDLLLFVNRWYNRYRVWRKREYWSLAGYIKQHIRSANLAIARYRQACCNYAKAHALDGIICGHIHHPEQRYLNGIHYINDGDWVENCTALAEDEHGNLSLIHYLTTDSVQNTPANQVHSSKAA
ncbi:UDP-2,3-diacylglucosamine diphosphatase [Salinimonas sp. HHU 13199]|uniref:UDP-2,3-diacylglucosamine diphosphatase n=1 Tax=Salinimonas profundi TaxID=2729140 RepID=A0ABR8LQD9_9ALTE|nr:UDP-2,3-diacylglucosamine diphosphatase [Salinimonas profundi]MBD3587286.1 UDP-2,3-diacylglucosamine diphosphatase [Salinimonas profundi]